jgi:ElaB/YqjD/DUF883 family membrane-anchored ribosome-binding protein
MREDTVMESKSENAGTGNAASSAGADKSSAENLAERGRAAANRLSSAMEAAKARVQEQTVQGARITDRAIREHPYETIGLAFGLGVLIGVLLGRR